MYKTQISNQLHPDCISVLMLLYIMLAYLMLFAALFNAVYLYYAYLFPFFILPFTFPMLIMQKCFVVCWLLTHFVYIIYYFFILPWVGEILMSFQDVPSLPS